MYTTTESLFQVLALGSTRASARCGLLAAAVGAEGQLRLVRLSQSQQLG